MRSSDRQARLALVAVILIIASSCGTPRPDADRGVDEAAIRQLLTENEVAANKHDAAGVAATYADDADIIAFAGGPVRGREAVQQHEVTFFSQAPQVEFSQSIRSIRFISDDVGIVEAESVHRFPGRETRERATVVVVRRQGRWSIAAVRVLPLQQQAQMFSSDLPSTSEMQQAADPDRGADEAAIRATLAANAAATNRRDASAVAATFTLDADLLLPGQPPITGVDAIRRNEEAFYRTQFDRWDLSVDAIRFLSRDVALVDATSSLVTRSGTMSSKDVIVMIRHGDRWLNGAVRAGLQ